MSRILYETVFGSRLYGCATPDSDVDIRGVYIPDPETILLGRKARAVALPVAAPELPASDDVLHQPVADFISHIVSMRTNAVEILFAAAADAARGRALTPEMHRILEAAPDLLNADISAFIGHAAQRAGMDFPDQIVLSGASRAPADAGLHALRATVAVLEQATDLGNPRLADSPELQARLTALDDITLAEGRDGAPHLRVAHRMFPFPLTRRQLATQLTSQIEGLRTKKAKEAETRTPEKRAKDLYTALRMIEQAAELLETGRITFPSPNAETYLDIRTGALPATQAADLVAGAMERVARAKEAPALPEKAREGAADALLLELHKSAVAPAFA